MLMALSGTLHPAWASPGCTGDCCTPPANFAHQPAAPCGTASGMRCGLEDAPLTGLSPSTPAMHHTNKPGAAVIQWHHVVEAAQWRPSPSIAPPGTSKPHRFGPPLYLAIAVLLR